MERLSVNFFLGICQESNAGASYKSEHFRSFIA